MSPRPKGRVAKSDLRERIIQAAWQQIAREGAPALSLRAIARDLEIAAPSIYNHFADRDALVTELILEAYESLGNHQFLACQKVSSSDPMEKLYSIGRAYREWALTYPERYQLIFGTPIPGYCAPVEETTAAATRSLGALFGVVRMLQQQDKLNVKTVMVPYFGESADPQEVDEKIALCAVTLIWTRVHGLISTEISNNQPPVSLSSADLFEMELKLIASQFFTD